MGAKISAYAPPDEEEDLFEPQVREIAGDDFSEQAFEALSGGRPFIKAAALYKHVQQKLDSLRKQEAIANMTVKSDAIENINQRNVAEGVHATVENLEKKIKMLRRARVHGVNPRSMKQVQWDIRKLRNDYIKFIGVKYYGTDLDFANDFVAEYFSVLDDPDRTIEDLSLYYGERSTVKFNGLQELRGREDTIDAMMVCVCQLLFHPVCCLTDEAGIRSTASFALKEKFDLLRLKHKVVKMEVTAPSPRGADYFIMCSSLVTVSAPHCATEVHILLIICLLRIAGAD